VVTAFVVMMTIRIVTAPKTSGAAPGMQWVTADAADLEFQVPVHWTVVRAGGNAATASDDVWTQLREVTGEAAAAGIPPRSTVELLVRDSDLSAITAVGVTSVPLSAVPTPAQVAQALTDAGLEHGAPVSVSTPIGEAVGYTTTEHTTGSGVRADAPSTSPAPSPSPSPSPTTPAGSSTTASSTPSASPTDGPLTAYYHHLLVPSSDGVTDIATVALSPATAEKVYDEVLATLRHPL
jgi:hypothetical protein